MVCPNLQMPEKVANSRIHEDVSQERAKRGTWSNPIEFTLSCLGLVVGLGNFWRFPYMCFENGGGAFLVPYTLMLALIGLPTFFLELSVGQYAGTGPITMWELAPLFQGIGIGMMIIGFIANTYYNMIIAWSLRYLVVSWQKHLPWQDCSHDFNTHNCFSKMHAISCEGEEAMGIWFNGTCYNTTHIGQFNNSAEREICSKGNKSTEISCWNETYNPFREWLENVTSHRVSASEEYFNLGVLARSDDIGNLGEVRYDLVIALLVAWIIVFLCVIKGIRSSGKAVYITATAPYLLLVILLIRGVLLEGSLEGIKFYIIPDWQKLAEPRVWADAANQIYFSLAMAYGALHSLASYNKLHNNVFKDAVCVAVGNCLTSLLAGFAVFSVLGHLAHVLGKKVKDVARSGSGLAFVAYAEVVTYLQPPQLWAILFFLILLLLGLDSQFAGIENIVTCTVDVLPRLRPYRLWIALGHCVVYFLLGILLCTQAGVYWVDLMSYYGNGWSMILMGLSEVMTIAYIYGASKLKKDIEFMIGHRLSIFWLVCWYCLTPLILAMVFIFTMVEFSPLAYGDYVLPSWAQGLGWIMAFSSILVIPLVAVVRIIQSGRLPEYKDLTLKQRISKLTKPSPKWKNWQSMEESDKDAREMIT